MIKCLKFYSKYDKIIYTYYHCLEYTQLENTSKRLMKKINYESEISE